MIVGVSVDDATVGEIEVESIEQNPLQAMRSLIEICWERGITLSKGTLVSTGAVTGVHEVQTTSKARLNFGSLGAFDVTFRAVAVG